MERESFSAGAPGELVKTIDGAWAFVPAPLPPVIELSWSLLAAVSQAEGALRQLAGVAHTLPNENLLIRPFLQREAVMSSRIEGTVASLPRLFVLDAAESAEEITPNFEEVVNYVQALRHGLERLPNFPVSLPLLQEMHVLLMRGVRGQNKAPGEFRKNQVWIGGRAAQSARFVPPPIPEMQSALRDFEKYLHAPSEIHFLVRLPLVHYQFEAIHPFLDGNGRIGRLLLSLLLCAEGVLPRPLLYLSGYFERNRQQYYDGLLHVSQRGEWMKWILFFLRGITEQADDAVRRSQQLMDLWMDNRHTLNEAGATPSAQRLLDELFVYPAVTIAGVARTLEVSKRTATQAVEKLVLCGILQEATGQRRNRVFVAGEISRILDAPEQAAELG